MQSRANKARRCYIGILAVIIKNQRIPAILIMIDDVGSNTNAFKTIPSTVCQACQNNMRKHMKTGGKHMGDSAIDTSYEQYRRYRCVTANETENVSRGDALSACITKVATH